MKRPNNSEFRAIFLQDRPLIDTRSPGEFDKGAFPSSVNLPLMSNEERARVGTCYKRQGQEQAIELGHRLVSGEIKARRVQAWVEFARAHPDGYLYCWRGGLRSQICQQWMQEAGVDYPRISGGYKAMRRYLIDQLKRICEQRPLVLLGGCTGGDKTGLIAGLTNGVDLEGLAHHRGSSFGRRAAEQPTQLGFENALAIALLKADARLPAGQPLVLEDEGRLIGRCMLPLPLQAAMARAPLVVLEVPLAERIEHSYRNYILDKLQEWQQTLGETAGFEAFAEDLLQSLHRVRKRLGGNRYQKADRLLREALEAHRRGNPDLHWDWILGLLVDYYDPMYDYQLSKRAHQVVFRGDRQAVRQYLQALKTQPVQP